MHLQSLIPRGIEKGNEMNCGIYERVTRLRTTLIHQCCSTSAYSKELLPRLSTWFGSNPQGIWYPTLSMFFNPCQPKASNDEAMGTVNQICFSKYLVSRMAL
jgi:hypothetical protein